MSSLEVVLPAFFNTAVGRKGRGEEGQTPFSPMLSFLKYVFYLLTPGLLLPVLLKLSSLPDLQSMDSLSEVTACYIAEHRLVPTVGDVDWSESEGRR